MWGSGWIRDGVFFFHICYISACSYKIFVGLIPFVVLFTWGVISGLFCMVKITGGNIG